MFELLSIKPTNPKSLNYIAIVEKADNNYSAYVPDLLGCTTTGETITEIQQNIQEVIIGHLEIMHEYGEPIPEPTAFHELSSPASIILEIIIPEPR